MQVIWSLFSSEPLVSYEAITSGHIHKTFKINTPKDQFVLQTFNSFVFKNRDAVVHNLLEVFHHLRTQLDYPYRILKPLSAKNGQYMVEVDGVYWRAFDYIESSLVLEVANTPEQAYHAAYGFGTFIRCLKSLSTNRLQTTIPDFHNGILRLRQLGESRNKDIYHRKKNCVEELRQIEKYAFILTEIEEKIESGFFPQRVIHYDTKINNILFDNSTQKPLCIIDLDTVMSGTVLSDFGDMIRTATPSVSENHSFPKAVYFRNNIYEGLLSGYREATHDFLTKEEQLHLPDGGKYLILMQAVRFLTDYLNGDVYYGAAYSEQNLHRAQHQLTLFQSFMNAVTSE